MITEVSPGWYHCSGCNTHCGREGINNGSCKYGLQNQCKGCAKRRKQVSVKGAPRTDDQLARAAKFLTRHD